MMSINSTEGIAFGAQVEGMREEVVETSHIALHLQCKHIPNELIMKYGYSRPSMLE
jgi:hypothetical protein